MSAGKVNPGAVFLGEKVMGEEKEQGGSVRHYSKTTVVCWKG